MRRFRSIVLVVILLWVAWLWFSPSSGPTVAPGSTLVVEISGSYLEAAEPSILSRLLGERRRPFVSILSDLRKAERDDRLKTVVFRIRDLELGWGKAQEIRDAIADLRRAGRKTLAHLELESFQSQKEYYVATAAESIYEAPASRAALVGLAAEYLFLGGMFEKIGVEVEVERIGRFKTAADTFAGHEMSPAHREMVDSLLDSIAGQFVAGIAEGRGLSPDAVRAAIERAPMTAEEMLELGLIDGISQYGELIDSLGSDPVIEDSKYAGVDPASLGFEPVAQFALVYGTGMVLVGKGATSRSGNPVLASDTVSTALRDAAADDAIDAIILRIDSPGGSALASDMVWSAVRAARKTGKPVIASVSDVAASGGYYVAVGADQVIASPGSLTGSIGVFVMRPVLGGMFQKLGIGVQPVTRGAHADLLLASQPLSPESRARLREEVESIYDLFVERVASGRKLSNDRVDELGQGRVWTGEQAAQAGLLDGLGGLRAAVSRAKVMLELDEDADVALITYPPPRSLPEQIGEALGGLRAAALPELPRLVRDLEPWLSALTDRTPALLPPVIVEIR